MLFKYLNTEETDPTVIEVSVTKKKTPTVKGKVTKKNTVVKAKNPKKKR